MKEFIGGLNWQMSNAERYVFVGLLRDLNPNFAIEIGTYMGGSLQVISRFAEKVISIDIDPDVLSRLEGKFQNVEYRIGDSNEIIQNLIMEFETKGQTPDFILIDGDHSSDGVRKDIEAIIKMTPMQTCTIIMHDSFNPGCRHGMVSADWESSPYVHSVQIDFVPGVYHYDARDTADAKTMWGGFAKVILQPEKRTKEIAILQPQRGLFEAVYKDSSHFIESQSQNHKESLFDKIKKFFS